MWGGPVDCGETICVRGRPSSGSRPRSTTILFFLIHFLFLFIFIFGTAAPLIGSGIPFHRYDDSRRHRSLLATRMRTHDLGGQASRHKSAYIVGIRSINTKAEAGAGRGVVPTGRLQRCIPQEGLGSSASPSGSIATSRAASRHNSARVRRQPSS
jgi:hypothetical protein